MKISKRTRVVHSTTQRRVHDLISITSFRRTKKVNIMKFSKRRRQLFIASCKEELPNGRRSQQFNQAHRSAGNLALMETCKPINSINVEGEYKRAFH